MSVFIVTFLLLYLSATWPWLTASITRLLTKMKASRFEAVVAIYFVEAFHLHRRQIFL